MSERAARLAGPALVAAWAVFALWTHWDRWSVDLSALWFAGYAFAGGDPEGLYSTGHGTLGNAVWNEIRAGLGGVEGTVSPYIYPPWVAGVVAPLARSMSLQAFFNLFYVVNIASIAASVLLAARLARPVGLHPALWCAISVALLVTGFPTQLSLDFNQVQNMVNLLTLGAFVLAASGRGALGGALLAGAAAIKLAPLFLAAIFLAERNWRALSGFAAGGAAFLALNFAVSLPGYDLAFLAKLGQLSDEILLSRISHSLEAALYVIAGAVQGLPTPTIGGFEWVTAPAWLGAVTKLALVAGILWALRITRRAGPHARLWLRLQMIATVVYLTGPLAWTHYLIFQTILAPGLLAIMPGRAGAAALTAFGAALSAPLFLALVALPGRELLATFWGFAVTLAWLGLLAICARIVARQPTDM